MTEPDPSPWAPEMVSVVIPVLNGAQTLAQQLEALSSQTYRGAWEVIVADNGSTDGTPDLVRSWADRLPALRVVDASDRRGINHARNVAVANARGDFLAFCDADDVVAPGWLEALADASRGCDIVGGWLDEETLNDAAARRWRPALPCDHLPIASRFLPYAVGANCGVRTSVMRALGGWNDDYARGGADVEFSWRAQLASYRIGFAPDAVVMYRHRSRLRSLVRQYYRYGRAEPQLYREFRDGGAPRGSIRDALLTWAWLLLHLPDLLRSPERKGIWLRKAAFSFGRLHGSLKYRVVCL